MNGTPADAFVPLASSGHAAAWFPEVVSWNVTERCNLRCGHCYLAAGRPAPDELSFDEGCQLIDRLVAAKARMLILSGGEPLQRRDIADLASYASAQGLVVVLGTNGMLLTPAVAKRLKNAGVSGVGISLDSVAPEKHDAFRGVPGAWRGAVRGIRAGVAEGLSVLVQMTVLPWNYQEVEAMIAFAHLERATGFNLYFLVCTGRGDQLTDITPQQYESVLASLVEAQGQYPSMMVRARCAPQVGRIASLRSSPLIGSAGCTAAKSYCRITPQGDVTPCPYLPLVAGNVREQPFYQIWQEAALFRRLREETPGGRCGGCEFQELCGGCRARTFALSGDLLGEDPWCAYQPEGTLQPIQAAILTWTPEAEARLQRIPPFIRERAKLAIERFAQAQRVLQITPAVMTATLEGLGRRPVSPPSLAARDQPKDGRGEQR